VASDHENALVMTTTKDSRNEKLEEQDKQEIA
jgi:hypothetical protein